LDRRLAGAQSRSGRGGEEKRIPACTGNRTPVVQYVIVLLVIIFTILTNVFCCRDYAAVGVSVSDGYFTVAITHPNACWKYFHLKDEWYRNDEPNKE
jgi:hypothetical protein